jgi:hypothetical protein
MCLWFIASADHFSECVESHAFETYDKFIKEEGGIFDVFSFLLCIFKILSVRVNGL